MRRCIAVHLPYILVMMVTLSVLLAYGVSGVGYFVIILCMVGIFTAGRYAEHVDARFGALERKDVDD